MATDILRHLGKGDRREFPTEEIRSAYLAGAPIKKLARLHKTSFTTIRHILAGEHWSQREPKTK